MTRCMHKHGAQVSALGSWVCGQCYSLLEQRPKRYGPPSVRIVDADRIPVPPQEIVWQAEVKKSSDGMTLATFLKAVARRFKSRCNSLTDYEAHKIALDAIKGMDAEFGHPDHDWSRTGAIDLADEEMSYWDEDAPAGNG